MRHAQRMRVKVSNAAVDLAQVFAMKRTAPGIQFVEDDARAEDVRRAVRYLVLYLLGREVRFVLQLLCRRLREQVLVAQQTKIQDFQRPARQHLDVAGIQEIVEHALRVGGVQG